MASNKALKYRIRTIPRTLTISSKWMGKREKIICWQVWVKNLFDKELMT